MQQPIETSYARGALYAFSAVCIWAAFIVVSRLGVRTGLTPWDIAAVRFAVAGIILLPYLATKGLALDRLGWSGFAAILGGGGAPLLLLVNAGLLFAPTAHAGALYPGASVLMVAVLGFILLKERFTSAKCIGLVLIALGAVLIVCNSSPEAASAFIGDALFLLAAFMWACFTIALKRAALSGLHAASIGAVGSLVFYVPPYVIATGGTLLKVPMFAIALQAFVQGILTAIVALVLYGRAVVILGATRGGAFVALTPVVTGLMGIVVLGEWPTATEWLSIASISSGVYILSGGPLTR